MQLGNAIGTACSTFAITNIDDLFVLVTFFAEASTSESMTALTITIGQYLGFSVIVLVSMIGYGVALVLPAEPIGFLGLLPMLLGIWKGLHILFPGYGQSQDGEDDTFNAGGERRSQELSEGRWEKLRRRGIKSMFSVALITIMNGGDNIGTYIPLFSQAQGAEIAVYIVVYYILLGVWIVVAWLIMKQKHILRIAEKWAEYVVPFLYVGLGIFIVVKSECYPWSVEKIDRSAGPNAGNISMGISTAAFILIYVAIMVWYHWRFRLAIVDESHETAEAVSESQGVESHQEIPADFTDSSRKKQSGTPTVAGTRSLEP